MSFERPAKRVRQACEPCRRKKSRCPGEKPICSHCSRLRQNCYYADERQDSERDNSPTPGLRLPQTPSTTSGTLILEDRLKYVESQLAEVLANQSSLSRSVLRHAEESPMRAVHHPRPPSSHQQISAVELPPWDELIATAEIYLLYCDCQPLPLFHRPSFIQTLRDREPEILFAILALALRFHGVSNYQSSHTAQINAYVKEARTMVEDKLNNGNVELSTIQALCIITLVDFTEGQTRRASICTSLAMSLAHNAGLTSETLMRLSDAEKEERRRCFWSLFLLKRLHGADFMVLDFAAEDNFPWYPKTTGSPSRQPPTSGMPNTPGNDPEGSTDKSIVAYAIQLSEVWFKTTRYAWRRGKPSALPPWSAQSEYHTILAQQMDFETRMPYMHRFEPAKFSQKSIEQLSSNRDYWGPWLFIQFLYHTNLCLLTHPLLMSLRLRNSKCVIPEIFLQHTSDLISSHASWIINFIDMLEAKGFKVTDPFLGHCVAIVATIYLQESSVDDDARRRKKQECFEKCLNFIRSFGAQWPHLGRIADKLQRLAETVSSTYVASEEPTRQNRKLLIDLGQFFEVLEYSSSSELPGSARKLFGASLHSTTAQARREIAQTSVLPEPTRVERQEFGNTPNQGTTPVNGASMQEIATLGSSETPFAQMMNYSDDELAVLAESFFHQSQGDGMGLHNAGNWWNMRYT